MKDDTSDGAWIPKDSKLLLRIECYYEFTTDINQIAYYENAIFGDTIEEAIDKIQELHPINSKITHPLVTNIDINAYDTTINILSGYILQDSPYDECIDMDLLISEMPHIKKLNTDYHQLYNDLGGATDASIHKLKEKLSKAGVVITDSCNLEYNPQKAKQSFLKSQKSRGRQKWRMKQINLNKVKSLLRNLQLSSNQIPDASTMTHYYPVDWYNTEQRIYLSIDIFNRFYGTNAHRRNQGFIKFKQSWKESAPATKKKFDKTFHKFMAIELAARQYKAKLKFKPVSGLRSCWARKIKEKEN